MKGNKQQGFSLIELIVTVVIVAILASATMPLLKMTVQRTKENELRTHLREMRAAIDAYKLAADQGRIKKNMDETGYPPSLEVLVEGVEDIKSPKRKTIKFLRRIPTDPMAVNDTVAGETVEASDMWGLRSYESPADEPEEGEDVFDVYSLSQKIGLNGVPYAKW